MTITENPPSDEVLHDGVKGMRWGYRKPEDPGTGRPVGRPPGSGSGGGSSGGSGGSRGGSGGGGGGGLRARYKGMSPRNQKLVTAAAIAGTVAVGALLLSRGNVSVWNSSSTKIAMGGARASANVLGKTGKVIVKGSYKTGKVVGKVGFKTGKVAGKAGFKSGVALSKQAGRAAATNGQNLYQNVLKPSAKMSTRLGSRLSYQLIGKGTPFVADTAKRTMKMNPVDLLLNTRADFPRRIRK